MDRGGASEIATAMRIRLHERRPRHAQGPWLRLYPAPGSQFQDFLNTRGVILKYSWCEGGSRVGMPTALILS